MSDFNNEESQLLDDDVLPEEFPPDRPMGVNERLTPAEEQVDEPLADRVAREEPDPLVQALEEEAAADEVGTLVAPGGDAGPDTEADAVAVALGTEDDLGALSADDILAGQPDLRDMAQERMNTAPAEEAAMHLTDPPPMGDGDGYLED